MIVCFIFVFLTENRAKQKTFDYFCSVELDCQSERKNWMKRGKEANCHDQRDFLTLLCFFRFFSTSFHLVNFRFLLPEIALFYLRRRSQKTRCYIWDYSNKLKFTVKTKQKEDVFITQCDIYTTGQNRKDYQTCHYHRN